jgi:hypothetical protein
VDNCAGWLYCTHSDYTQFESLINNHCVELFNGFTITKHEIGHDIIVRNKRIF